MFTSPRQKKKRSRHPDFVLKSKHDTLKTGVAVDTQELIPLFSYADVPYCIFCKRTSAPLIKLPSGIFINLTGYVHEMCLKNKGCCECGVLGLCYRCTVKDCQRLIHSWCSTFLHGNPNFCDLHSTSNKKKESARLPFIKSVSRQILSSSFWEKDYKEKDSAATLCNGHIFWYLLSLEYFPPGYDLSCFPTFPLCTQFDFEYDFVSSSTPISRMIEKASNDLEKVQLMNSRLISQIHCSLSSKTQNSNDLMSLNGQNENFAGYIDLVDLIPETYQNPGSSEALNSNLQPKSALLCEICQEELEESMMVCNICKIAVHAKCYKVQFSENFTCELCNFTGRASEANCVLCPIKSGLFKQTLHYVKDILFPTYTSDLVTKDSKDCKQPIWVHCFCASHTSGIVYRPNGVDLSGIDTTKLSILCEICNTKEGICLQCTFSRCSAHFHANCGKKLFVSTKSSDKKIFCSLHKPVKLRKMLENRQRQLHEDVYKLCKAMDKYFARIKVQAKILKKKKKSKLKLNLGKNFNNDEDLLLEYRIQQFLYKLNVSQRKPFELNIDLKASTRCSRINISRPQFYTLISPTVILEENISIDNRSAEECFKRYSDTLYNKLKNEILLLGQRLCIYQGKEIITTKHYTKPKKRNQEHKPRVSSDTYCICDQPYYYEIPWMAEWTQEQWEEKIRENEMIECTKCEKWFHLKCVGYEGSLEKAQQDENWKCGTCDDKKTEKMKFDKNLNTGEVASGVVTRRGTKIL